MFSRVVNAVSGTISGQSESLNMMKEEVNALEILSRQIFMDLDDLNIEKVCVC
jgi:hypothetical protein